MRAPKVLAGWVPRSGASRDGGMMNAYEGLAYRGAGGHVESYFLKINDPAGERALWLKATILAHKGRGGDDAVAESWAVAFERGKRAAASKTTVPLAQASFSRDKLDITMPGFELTRGRAQGEVGDVGFTLALSDDGAPIVHFPHPRMYSGPFPSSKLTSPMPNLRAHGEVRTPRGTWKVDGWHGLLGHNWGRGHAFAYAWGHCNVWNEEEAADLVFEGTSARVRVGPALLPTTTLLIGRTGGETHALTRLRRLVRNQGAMTFRRWTFSGSGPTISLHGEMWAETDDMVGLHYENPDGAMTYCLNSKLASARLEISIRGRAWVATSRAAALEIGTRDPNHGVEMVL